MKFWIKIKEIMARPKNPRIKALESKVVKLQERLSIYESVSLEATEEEIEAEVEIVRSEVSDGNYTQFKFELTDNGEYVAIQQHPESLIFKLGDNGMRAELQVKKLLAHGNILPKKSK